VLRDRSAIDLLRQRTRDDDPAVRVAAALALCRLGEHATGASLLADHIGHDNLIVGMYAIRALEQIGVEARSQLPAIKAAQQSSYEFTRRYARRLAQNLAEANRPPQGPDRGTSH
jgi:HEAT repeat protein